MVVEFVATQSGERVLANVRPSSFSLTIDVSTVYNFDLSGRLLGAYINGRNYMRGLDNRVLVKWGAGHGLAHRARHDLSDSEKRAFFAGVIQRIAAVEHAVRSGAIEPAAAGLAPDALPRVLQALAGVLGYDALEQDAQRFRAIYKPISILPPDQYLAVVLQATEGCSWNQCTFCDFYKDRPFRIKDEDEFRRHVRAVLGFLGQEAHLRRSVFLADANALAIPQARLLRLLDIVNGELTIVPGSLQGEQRRQWQAEHPNALGGIYSFVDAFTTRSKTVNDYRQLAERNVRRVYIGLESGDDTLLDFLNKGSTAGDAVETVSRIKAGGLDVGVIVMLGAGGDRYAADHVRNSAAALNAMQLGGSDIIYFSPFMDFPGSQYAARAAELGVRPLSGPEMDQQMADMRAALRFTSAHDAPKIAVYDIREFIY